MTDGSHARPLRLVVVDDHEVVRQGLVALLDRREGLQVVAEAGSVAESLEMSRKFQPDIVVMDVRLPDGSGIEACREIRSELPATKVVILTSYPDEEAVLSAIVAGASGYLLKQVRARDLVAALESGKVRAYGTDVWPSDPPPADCPLLTAPNVFMAPHIGASSTESSPVTGSWNGRGTHVLVATSDGGVDASSITPRCTTPGQSSSANSTTFVGVSCRSTDARSAYVSAVVICCTLNLDIIRSVSGRRAGRRGRRQQEEREMKATTRRILLLEMM